MMCCVFSVILFPKFSPGSMCWSFWSIRYAAIHQAHMHRWHICMHSHDLQIQTTVETITEQPTLACSVIIDYFMDIHRYSEDRMRDKMGERERESD